MQSGSAISKGAAVWGVKTVKHAPGSPEAIAQGCKCSPMLNRSGQGLPGDYAPRHSVEEDCPLHGLGFLRQALTGITVVECGLIVALIAIAAVTLIATFGLQLSTIFHAVITKF